MFPLKRGYALQLPNSYVEIDRDEMEYVDGAGWLAWTCGTVGGAAAMFIEIISDIYLIKKGIKVDDKSREFKF